MKIFFLSCAIFCLFFQDLLSQKTIEESLITCRYQYHYIKDTLNPKAYRQDIMELQIGKTTSKFYSYRMHLRDSMIEVDIAAGVNILAAMASPKYKENSAGIAPVIYKNYPKGKLSYTDYIVSLDYIKYEEPMPVQSWQILSDTATICGYLCKKAKCIFRGRAYTAWFTEDIAVSDGPWKFSGLPGLILSVRDSRNYFVYTCMSVKKSNRIIFFNDKRNYTQLSRKEWLQIEAKVLKDPVSMIEGMGGIITLPPGKSRASVGAYNPMELE